MFNVQANRKIVSCVPVVLTKMSQFCFVILCSSLVEPDFWGDCLDLHPKTIQVCAIFTINRNHFAHSAHLIDICRKCLPFTTDVGSWSWCFWNPFMTGLSHYTTECHKVSFILISDTLSMLFFICTVYLDLMDCCYRGFVLFCLTGLTMLWLRAFLPTGSVLSVVYHRVRS